MREATPAAINVDGSATGASESTMACDTGLAEPVPLQQATIKINHLLKDICDSRTRTLAPATLAPALVLL